MLFGSRDAAKARRVAADGAASARAGSFDDAAAFGDVVLYTVRDVLPSQLLRHSQVLAGKVVIDCNNSAILGFDTPDPYAAPRMRPDGSITFLTGGSAVRPRAGATMVTAAFAALEAFSQALALELGPMRVNTIRPGIVDSAMWDFLDDAAREHLRQTVRATFPARRVGTIDDIGHTAVFLMTNPYVTGAVLEVSGGETLVALAL